MGLLDVDEFDRWRGQASATRDAAAATRAACYYRETDASAALSDLDRIVGAIDAVWSELAADLGPGPTEGPER